MEQKQNLKATVIISIYNNIQALKVVLDSLKAQTEKAFEIIISEDADFQEVSDFINTYTFENPYQLLTQEDKGWRKNRALNRAIKASNTNWLIFIDGDCVLHPNFVESHLLLSGEKNILAGKRIKLDSEMSSYLINDYNNYKHIFQKVLKRYFAGNRDTKFIEEGFYAKPNSLIGKIMSLRKMHQLKGCNMSFSKKAIESINGFNEEYIRPAIGEDIDLTWRFKGLGYKIVSARNLAVQYHLYHKENWVSQEENQKIMEKCIQEKKYICDSGLKQLK